MSGDHPEDDLKQHIARASHELGNLLGIVLNYSTLLTRQLTRPAQLADVGQIHLAAQRATEVVRSLAAAAFDDGDQGDGA